MAEGYPTDLTDAEWAVLEPLLPAAKPGGRPRTTCLRQVLEAIFYVLRSGCQWRMVPKEFPPYQTVYEYFRTWRVTGVWERLHDTLRGDVRAMPTHEHSPYRWWATKLRLASAGHPRKRRRRPSAEPKRRQNGCSRDVGQ